MENIPSLTPGTQIIAHWPGICSKSLPPSGAFHAEGFDIRSLLTDIGDHANLRDQGVQGIVLYDRYIHSFFGTSLFFKGLDDLYDI